MKKQYFVAAAIDGRGKDVFKTDRATYDSLYLLEKLIADAYYRISTLIIMEE